MVVIRAQDFASRTLRRVGGEFAGMSRLQAEQLRTQKRLGTNRAEIQRLNVLQRNIDMQRTMNTLAERQQLLEARAAARTPGGRLSRSKDAIAARQELTRLLPVMDRMNQAQSITAQEIGQMPRRYRSLALSAADVGERLGKVRAETSELTETNRLLGKAIPIDRMDNFGRALSGLGRTAQLFGAISTVAFGVSAAKAAEFATEATNAATQMRDLNTQTRAQGLAQIDQRTDQLTNGLRQNGVEIAGILDLMTQYPATANEMSAAAYDIFSSMQLQKNGVTDVAAGMQLLETANKVAVAGQVDLATATNVMITTLNNFARTGEDTNEVLDTMFDIVRFGRMRLSDFDVMMNKIAPAAAGAGQSLEDVGGAMAFLTEVMPSQRMVATGISRLIEGLQHPDIVKGLKNAGIEAENAAGELRPLPELLTEINEKLNPRNAAKFFRLISASGRGGGRGIIFTQEGRRAFNQIMQNMDGYLERQEQIEQNTGEFGTALEANLRSIGVQWNIFLNQVRALVIVIGTEAVPVFAQLGGWIENLVQWFSNLDPETRRLIVQIGVFAAVGTLLGGVLAAIIGSLVTLAAHLRMVFLAGVPLEASMASLVGIFSRLAGIGAIAIGLKVLWTGEATGRDFLMGALAGAGAGALFGPVGIVTGAITVPIILKMIDDARKSPVQEAWDKMQKDLGGNPSFFDAINKPLLEAIPSLKKWSDSAGKTFGMTRDEFQRQWDVMLTHHKKVTQIIERAPNKSAARFYIRNLKNEIAGLSPQVKALFAEFGPKRRKQQETQNWFDQMRQNLKSGTKEQQSFLNQLEQWYNQVNEGGGEAVQRQGELANAIDQATQQAMSSMRTFFTQLRSENEAAMGELFQGPWLTSETFDLAKEWGITPRIEDMILDLRQQNNKFMQWRRDLDKLFARGLPPELINELQKMGPDQGQAFVQNLLKAKPGQVQAIIREWKQRNKLIEDATKMDFSRQIDHFRKAGVNMGEALINGFQDAQVGQWFDNWIKAKFPDVINSAVANAKEEFKKATPPGGRRGDNPPPPMPTTKGTTNNTTTNNKTEKKVEVKVDMTSGDSRDRAREAAFIIANKVKGAT